jgi:geranylgeranyl diphosphate synthase type II
MKPSLLDFDGFVSIFTPHLEKQMEEISKTTPLLHSGYRTLMDSIRHDLMIGVKRRPFLAYLAYTGFGGTDTTTCLGLGCALEILEISVLTHDDIIDEDITRRGQINTFGAYQQMYAVDGLDEVSAKHHARAATMLAGDSLLAESIYLLNGLATSPAVARIIQKEFIDATHHVNAGQLLDLDLDSRCSMEVVTRQEILDVYLTKTTYFGSIFPMRAGAVLAGASESQIDSLVPFAMNLSLAIQVANDSNVLFDHAIDSKSAGDLRQGKKTLLNVYGWTMTTGSDHERFRKLFGNASITPKDVKEAREILTRSGAKEAALAEGRAYLQSALKSIDTIEGFDKAARTALEQLTETIGTRLT